MPNMYFAKININQDIYTVYKDSSAKDRIIDNLLEKNWQEKYHIETVKDKFTKGYNNITYKFINIDKQYDSGFVVGLLIMIFQDELSLYDKDTDDIKDLSESMLSRAVPFYFDINSEIVAFVPAKNFSWKKFIKEFKELINLTYGEDMFAVFIKNNAGSLRRKIQTLMKVRKIEII